MKFLTKIVTAVALVVSFNASALMIKLDFSTVGSTDMWGNVTNAFDETQAVGLGASFSTLTNNILQAVRQDYYSSAYGFIGPNQELNIDFMIAPVGLNVSGIDPNNYTIQIGSRTSGPHNGFGVACVACVSNATVAPNSIFGSVFSNNIFSALTGLAGGVWDMSEAVNAIAGTLSHEIGHGLGLPHPSGPQTNPGQSIYGIMATGASPSSMPGSQRLLDRAFSDTYMLQLVQTLGLRTTAQVPEPPMLALLIAACMILLNRKRNHA